MTFANQTIVGAAYTEALIEDRQVSHIRFAFVSHMQGWALWKFNGNWPVGYWN